MAARYATLTVPHPNPTNVYHALEVGIGNDPAEALAFDEWQPLR